jgi:acyl carrier protein
MRNRLVDVMAAVLGLSAAEVSDDMSFGYTKNWDSLRHMNLILALEDEFGVTFTDEEVVEMISVPLIVEILNGKNPA